MHLSDNSPNELIVAYKNPACIERIDIRNTKKSTISGTKSPSLLSSCILDLGDDVSIVSMLPFLSEVGKGYRTYN